MTPRVAQALKVNGAFNDLLSFPATGANPARPAELNPGYGNLGAQK